jgi:hypothetical protein
MESEFEHLEHLLKDTHDTGERKILLEAMARVGNFEELGRQLKVTYTTDERKILLDAMAWVGNFEELGRQLKVTYTTDERKILLQGITKHSQDLAQGTNKGTRRNLRPGVKPLGKKYDLFMAHASEDKNFVTPLALSLSQRGLEVWYDDFILKVGDSLGQEIDRGLAQSSYGVVVLSHNFFGKRWPQKELNGLAAREQLGRKVILPVWHNIDKEEVTSYSLTLADIYAIKSSAGIETVTVEIIKAISPDSLNGKEVNYA